MSEWLLAKGCGSGGLRIMEFKHPEITFGTPQTWVRVRLKDVLPQNAG